MAKIPTKHHWESCRNKEMKQPWKYGKHIEYKIYIYIYTVYIYIHKYLALSSYQFVSGSDC